MSSTEARAVITASLQQRYPNLNVIRETPYLLRLHTIIRNKDTTRADFLFYADQLNRTLIEYAFESGSYCESVVTTPTGNPFVGLKLQKEIIGVSIMRAGEAMESALRSTVRGAKIGKILIQRDEATPNKEAKLFYSKLPENLENYSILLMDPMLASGSSASLAVQVLIDRGVREEDITFVNLIASPEGLQHMFEAHPKLRIVTTMVDSHLNAQKFIIPGVGDYGDRYFGT